VPSVAERTCNASFRSAPAEVVAHPEVIQAYLGKPQERS